MPVIRRLLGLNADETKVEETSNEQGSDKKRHVILNSNNGSRIEIDCVSVNIVGGWVVVLRDDGTQSFYSPNHVESFQLSLLEQEK